MSSTRATSTRCSSATFLPRRLHGLPRGRASRCRIGSRSPASSEPNISATTLVLDASTAIYLACTAEGFASLAASELVAPALFWSESLSGLHQGLYRGAISRELADHARTSLAAAPIERREPAGLLERAWSIADALGWAKTYDAEYVALAQILDCPLLTRDGRLYRAASGIATIIGPAQL
jgi:predicted nucleic acid-binding protein